MPDQPETDERALVQRALHDPDAFEALYARYVRRVYAYVAARTSNPQDAEDVVADIFLRVVRSLDQLHNAHHTSFAAWLFAVARSAVVDHYRRSDQARAHVALSDAGPLAAPDAEPEQALHAAEDAAKLRALIAALPERQREIVMLRYYGGLRNQEIAAVLQIGEKTVSGYLSRALRDLHTRYTLASPPSQPDTEPRSTPNVR